MRFVKHLLIFALRSTINTQFVSQVSWRKIQSISDFIVIVTYAVTLCRLQEYCSFLTASIWIILTGLAFYFSKNLRLPLFRGILYHVPNALECLIFLEVPIFMDWTKVTHLWVHKKPLKTVWLDCKVQYLHLPSIFPIKHVGGPSVLMRAWIASLFKSAQRHLYRSAKR